MPHDFSGKNLRGKSFIGQNLSGSNFSKADIRGVSFTNAILTSTNFSQAKSGLRSSWSILLILLICSMSVLTGLVLGYAGAFPAFFVAIISEEGLLAQVTIVGAGLLILGSFFAVLLLRGIGVALGIFAVLVATSTAIMAFLGEESSPIIAAALIQAIAIAISIAGVLVCSLMIVLSQITAGVKLRLLIGLLMILTSIVGALEGAGSIDKPFVAFAFVLIALITTVLLSLGLFIGFRAIAGDRKYAVIYKLSINLCTIGGTSFRGAILKDANFDGAILKYADFRNADLTRTSWFKAQKVGQARVEGTYLKNGSIRRLLISKDGQNQEYNTLNLQGINLQGACLSGISLIGSNLSESTFRSADLSHAKLAKAQLYGADLTEACLTGATIEDWAISTDTCLEQVKCDYIYMHLTTPADRDPWRKPDNRNDTFQEGDFSDFITPIIKTLDLYRQQNVDPRQMAKTFKSLDLYHYGGIDPAAAAIALQQLSEENPEVGLEIVALEGRGEEKVRLQAAVTTTARNSKLNSQYFEKYHQISSLPYRDVQALLAEAAEKDQRIRSLEELLENALQQPKFYVETYQNQGEFIMSQSKGNVNISGVQGNVSGVASAGENQALSGVLIGHISGSVTNQINQLPASSSHNSPGIKELLTQLQLAIEAESELQDEDKAEALEQVKTLAEAGEKPESNALHKAAKTSMKILKGTVASLPDAAKLTEACAKLLPAIATLLALI